ncbi:MAG: MarR family transcriptional regulator [Acidimicrobiales bacterium]|nr:MarR family transcriptional regulator [Acidimicrobiales bacterium]MCB1250666.1 MarR family transcriptional regulator [Acidimicrobiales bacterium]MCB1262475.1 MarR family transcriptional regulator [Acidimicrobiales bacterium]
MTELLPPVERAVRASVDDLDDDRITLAGMLFEAAAALERTTVPSIEALGLTTQAFEALLRLARTPEHRLRMSELANAMTSITPSGLTRLVDRLESVGYVERAMCPSDRRGSFAQLTESGMDVVLAVIPQHLADLDEHLWRLLTVRQRGELEALLRVVRDANAR